MKQILIAFLLTISFSCTKDDTTSKCGIVFEKRPDVNNGCFIVVNYPDGSRKEFPALVGECTATAIGSEWCK